MERFYRHEIERVSQIWHDVYHKPWLLVVDFAEIDGRLECVGMAVRSYIRHETRVITGKVDGQDAWVTYDAFWTGESLVAPEPRTDDKIDWELGRRDVPWHDLARHDLLAVQAQAQDDPAMFSPRPLRTETLRDLPLGRQLQEARGEVARRIGRLAEAISDLHLAAQREAGNTEAVLRLEQYKEELTEARASIVAESKRPGRPRKYDRPMLEAVARLYREAHRSGSPRPTRDVEEALGLGSRSIAAKLVMKCREEGLLPPAAPRRRGGVDQTDTQQRDRP